MSKLLVGEIDTGSKCHRNEEDQVNLHSKRNREKCKKRKRGKRELKRRVK